MNNGITNVNIKKTILLIGFIFDIFLYFTAFWGLEGIAAFILNKEKVTLGSLVHAHTDIFMLLMACYIGAILWTLFVGIVYLIRRDLILLYVFLISLSLFLISIFRHR
ncbi:hypothetical protein [Leptospira borgpetersenii]|uniref:hypothetical protein n=1 Tax=Leptospira borgpetersenii TaxID=174 RepID=UPI0020212C73|nr:hypothetical protein [Leptospira borgpetersenii]URD70537.1 hypothetical protein LIX26_03195 [Leptospira borgpetersenii]UVD73713.1 hypothetical protein NU962_03190 [Leptospira borgpetersenii]UVD76907.1 hypothetical protein LIX27_03200 [Leptospira borgpetersenii]UZW33466.1 hypothetical protein OR565_03190 [Leptospira borgpetersenii]